MTALLFWFLALVGLNSPADCVPVAPGAQQCAPLPAPAPEEQADAQVDRTPTQRRATSFSFTDISNGF